MGRCSWQGCAMGRCVWFPQWGHTCGAHGELAHDGGSLWYPPWGGDHHAPGAHDEDRPMGSTCDRRVSTMGEAHGAHHGGLPWMEEAHGDV